MNLKIAQEVNITTKIEGYENPLVKIDWFHKINQIYANKVLLYILFQIVVQSLLTLFLTGSGMTLPDGAGPYGPI